MRLFKREGVEPTTAEEAIRESYRSPELQQLFVSLIGGKAPTRKEEITAALLKLLDGDRFEVSLGKLTARERVMVAQPAWSEDGFFDRDRFDARQGTTSSGRTGDGDGDDDDDDDDDDDSIRIGSRSDAARNRKRSWIELFLPQDVLARDIQQRIRALLPEPAAPGVRAVDTPPDAVDQKFYEWNAETKLREQRTEAVPIVRREMDQAALRDVTAVLRLVDAGKVPVSEKNHTPKPAAVKTITAVLDGGDFFPEDEKPKSVDGWEYETAGPIRAFAWPMLLQAGKLATVRASRLELIPAGRKALLSPPADVLRDLWAKWVKSDLLDELRRIDVIRGQTGNGHRYLSKPAGRREKIAAALRECPVGQWVALDDFSRHMRAAGHEFVVTSNSWSLYIVPPAAACGVRTSGCKHLAVLFILDFEQGDGYS
jgi:hypothetical protein